MSVHTQAHTHMQGQHSSTVHAVTADRRSSGCGVEFPHDESVILAGSCLLLCFPRRLTHPSNLWEGGRDGLCHCHNTGLLSTMHFLKGMWKMPWSFCGLLCLCVLTSLRLHFLFLSHYRLSLCSSGLLSPIVYGFHSNSYFTQAFFPNLFLAYARNMTKNHNFILRVLFWYALHLFPVSPWTLYLILYTASYLTHIKKIISISSARILSCVTVTWEVRVICFWDTETHKGSLNTWGFCNSTTSNHWDKSVLLPPPPTFSLSVWIPGLISWHLRCCSALAD